MKLAILSTLFGAAYSHVTMNPNYGAGAGGYFKTSIKVPHGSHGFETTKIVVKVPHGVLSAAPEALHGWDVTVNTRPITPYISHGNTVSTGPSEIIWEAVCTGTGAPNTCDNADHVGLHNSHLLELEVQLKVGCDFGVDSSGNAQGDATIWMDQHTLWWNTEQYVSTPGTNDGNTNANNEMLNWSGICDGTASWGAGCGASKPSPYTFIYSTEKCTPADTTGSEPNGMRWGSPAQIITPAVNQEAVKSKAEVISLVEEQMLTTEEAYDIKFAKSEAKSEEAKDEAEKAAMVAIFAAGISALLLLMVFITVSVRVANPTGFKRILLSDTDAYAVRANDYDKAVVGDNDL